MTTTTQILPSELRIGNWVSKPLGLGDKRLICQIKSINSDEMGIEGIEITHEILEKAGFAYRGIIEINRYEFEEVYTVRIDEVNYNACKIDSDYGNIPESYWRFKVDYDIILIRYPLIYLHQIQNAIHLFTGEELEINL